MYRTWTISKKVMYAWKGTQKCFNVCRSQHKWVIVDLFLKGFVHCVILYTRIYHNFYNIFRTKKEYAKQNHLKIRQLKLPTEEEKEKITNVNIFSRSVCTLYLIINPLDVSENKIRTRFYVKIGCYGNFVAKNTLNLK